MFLNNKYTKIYQLIIKKATDRNISNRELARQTLGYIEQHHIIPKCIGGTNDINNLVFLTPKEHFMCHRLLVKMTTDKNRVKMIYALHKMMSKNSNQKRIIFTSRQYQEIRSLIMSTKGENHYNKGKKRSEEWKNNRRLLYTGENNPNFGNKGNKNPLFGKQSKKKYGNKKEHNPMFGKQHSEKARNAMTEKALTRPKLCCLYCRKISDISNFVRWHGVKCKIKL